MSRFVAAIKSLFSSNAFGYAGPVAGTDRCTKANDPSRVFESLATPQHWGMGADMADAYGGACVSACAGSAETWGSIWSY